MAMRTSPRQRQAGATAAVRKHRTAIERMARRGARIEEIDIAAIKATPNVDFYDDMDWLIAHHERIPRAPIEAARYAKYEFENMCAQALRSRRLSDEQASALAIARGEKGMTERLLMSNSLIRFEATRLFLNILTAFWKQTRSPTRRWFFITFIGDEGNALEYRPELRVKPFRRKVDKLLRDAGLDAFVVIELQTLTNFPQQGNGGTIMVHAHALAWTDDPEFDHKKVAAEMCDKRRLSHWLDAPTVKIKPVKDTAKQIRWRAYYLFKAPYVGKILVPSDIPGRDWKLKHTTIRPHQTLRLAEGLSQLEFSDVAFGVNGGTKLSRALKCQLLEWHKKQLRSPRRRRFILPKEVDVASLWEPTRRSNKQVQREPILFHGTAEKYPLGWSVIAQEAMAVLNGET